MAIDFKARASKAMRAIGVRHPQFLIAWRRVCDLVNVDASATDTFAIDDRGCIYINPTFAESLSPSQFGAVLVHELMHLALDHAGRERALGLVSADGQIVDHEGFKLFNRAGDFVINEAMRRDGFDLPACAVYPPQDYPSHLGRTTEDFYFWLREKKQARSGGEQGEGKGAPSIGEGCGPKPTEGKASKGGGLSESEVRQLGREVRASASAMGIGAGASACLDALEPTPGRLAWERLLRSGFESAIARKGMDRPTYARRSRRSPPGAIMPGWIATEPKIVIVIDVSGSMARAWIDRIVGEVQRLASIYNAPAYLVTHTDRVTWQGWIKPGQSERIGEAVAFSGGTYAGPAYFAAGEAGRFDTMVHFTDCELESPWPECPARRLIVGAFGRGASAPLSKPPEGAELIAVIEG